MHRTRIADKTHVFAHERSRAFLVYRAVCVTLACSAQSVLATTGGYEGQVLTLAPLHGTGSNLHDWMDRPKWVDLIWFATSRYCLSHNPS